MVYFFFVLFNFVLLVFFHFVFVFKINFVCLTVFSVFFFLFCNQNKLAAEAARIAATAAKLLLYALEILCCSLSFRLQLKKLP